ncbi:MAG: hypothetical protein AAF846_05845 [Chloroflexota bacterium]
MFTSTEKLPLWALIVPALLVALYTMLSWLAFTDPTFFYESMEIPIPEHGFMLLSWGGKNGAIVVALLLATLSRQRLPIWIMLVALVTMQFGDINAGFQTNVNVFITYIGLTMVVIEAGLLVFAYNRQTNQTTLQPA